MTTRTLLFAGCACVGILTGMLAQRIRHGRAVEQPGRTRAAADHGTTAESSPAEVHAAPSSVVEPQADRPLEPSGDVIGNVDPRSKDYDPITLSRVTRTRPSELLSKEPRDPAFAETRERALRARLAVRLRTRISFETRVDVECRTSSCDVTVQGPASVDDMNAVLDAIDLGALSEVTEIGTTTGEGSSDQRAMKIVMLYSAERRDHASYDQVLKQHEAHDEPPRTP